MIRPWYSHETQWHENDHPISNMAQLHPAICARRFGTKGPSVSFTPVLPMTPIKKMQRSGYFPSRVSVRALPEYQEYLNRKPAMAEVLAWSDWMVDSGCRPISNPI